MSDKTEYSRLLLKRSGIPGEVPTFTTGTTLNEMIPTDLFVGEMYLNTADDLMWVRTDNGILPIALSGMTGTTIPTLLEVLGTGNITGGFDIYVSSGTTIQYEGLNTGSTTTILGLDASGNTITTSVAGATQDLDNVLSYGNSTGAYNIIVSSGQTIQYQGLSNGSSNTILALDTTGGTITTSVSDNDTYITGGTITYTGSNGTLDLFDNSGSTISITGLTDIFTTGGTYSSSDGELSLTRNDGTTYTINGFFTGYTNLVETLTTGTGLSGDTTTGNVTIVNTAPDQVVTLTNGNNINIIGTYPNFTISSTGGGGGGGGGELYYFNISNSQSPYYEFSPSGTSVSEQTLSATTGNTQTAYIGGFMTPSGVPNITEMPAGILSFYLHFKTDFSTATFDAYVQLYKRTTGGTETLLFTSDTKEVIGTTEDMYILDGFFSGATLNKSDRLVVKILATNTSNTTRTIIFTTEGTQHYSFSLTTIPIVPSLSQVLEAGNITSNHNIVVSANQTIEYLGLSQGTSNTLLALDTTGGTITTLAQDIYTTGGTYSSSDGELTLNRNDGNSYTINGFFTGYTNLVETLTAGTGLSGNTTTGNVTLINTAPDQTVVLNNGSNISVTGTYPNFTIAATGLTDYYVTGGTYSNGTLTLDRQNGSVNVSGLFTGYTSVVNSLTTGTGLSANTTNGDITILNTAPDQTVVLNSGTGISTSGTYPNFTITNTAPNQTVTISGGTGILTGGTYPNFTLQNTIVNGSFGITIDGGGSAITTGVKGYITIPYNCTITGWDIFSDVSGSIVVDVWKDTYANFPPTVADTIAGSEKPTLSSAVKNQDNLLSTWTTSVSANDIIAFNVDSASTLTRVNLTIKVLKTS